VIGDKDEGFLLLKPECTGEIIDERGNEPTCKLEVA
jgi:hypothetical protein